MYSVNRHGNTLPFTYFHYMIKTITVLALSLILFACKQTNPAADPATAIKEIGNTLDSFNRAAARADFNAYFPYLKVEFLLKIYVLVISIISPIKKRTAS